MPRGQRKICANSGSAAMPITSRSSARTTLVISASSSCAAASMPARPRKLRSSTWPSGARPGNLLELHVVAITGRFSARGTTKPKPVRSCATWSRRKASEAVAVLTYWMDERSGRRERRDRAQQVAARPGRRGQHDRVDDHAAAVGQLERVGAGPGTGGAAAGAARRHRPHRRAAVQALRRQRGDHGVAELLQAALERVEVRARAALGARRPARAAAAGRPGRRRLLPRLAPLEHREDEAAMLAAPSRGTSGRWRARSSARGRRRGCRRRWARRCAPAPPCRAAAARSRRGSRRRPRRRPAPRRRAAARGPCPCAPCRASSSGC